MDEEPNKRIQNAVFEGVAAPLRAGGMVEEQLVQVLSALNRKINKHFYRAKEQATMTDEKRQKNNLNKKIKGRTAAVSIEK